jgi:hypothetical protein
MLPCSTEQAIAQLIKLLPQRAVDAALRFRSSSRYSAAKLALKHLAGCRLTVEGNMLTEKQVRGQSIGTDVLRRLKTNLVIDESETGFMRSSNKTYRLALRSLGWIIVEGTSWKWIGPDSAEWSAVTKENQRKKT